MYTPVFMTKGDHFRLIKMKQRLKWRLGMLDVEEAKLRIKLATVEEQMMKAGIPLDRPAQQELSL